MVFFLAPARNQNHLCMCFLSDILPPLCITSYVCMHAKFFATVRVPLLATHRLQPKPDFSVHGVPQAEYWWVATPFSTDYQLVISMTTTKANLLVYSALLLLSYFYRKEYLAFLTIMKSVSRAILCNNLLWFPTGGTIYRGRKVNRLLIKLRFNHNRQRQLLNQRKKNTDQVSCFQYS